jgi:hypothetical protein
MGNSKIDKYRRAQQSVLDEMKKVARSVGKSIAQIAPWTPFEEAEPIPELPNDVIMVNSRYQVNIKFGVAPAPFGKFLELSIKTRDKAAFHDWRDFQRIKNELVGEENEGVELYPAESRLVDTANQYYMFVFRPGFKLPFGYTTRLVAGEGVFGSAQRPFENPPTDLMNGEQFKKFVDSQMRNPGAWTNGKSAIPNRGSEEVAGRHPGAGEEKAPR